MKDILVILSTVLFCFNANATESVVSQNGVKLLRNIYIPSGLTLSNYAPPKFDGFSATTAHKTTEVGGISGIQMTSNTKFVAVTDARSRDSEGFTRAYKGHFTNNYTEAVIDEIILLRDQDGKPFPPNDKDPESIVVLENGNYLWGSEANHAIMLSKSDGTLIKNMSYLLPEYYRGDNKTFGLRKNQSIEGMSISPDGSTLFVATESSLIQDGDQSTPVLPATSRILKYSIDDNSEFTLVGEYTYIVSRIEKTSIFGIHDNGVSDILALDNDHLLVMERNGFAVKKGFCCFDFNINVFKADLTEATDIRGIANLNAIDTPTPIIPAQKSLYFRFNELLSGEQRIDNLEGMTFGPNINGKPTLVFTSDNNFQSYSTNQFVITTTGNID
ncbi:esterase-like activity of phytase family protein [Vibrio mediterranei]|uniref:esterase-like activity of phytase family protein n=1 Tax=Vibrio mediterranei TaxID=689 RepID=UPI0022851B85|nr:esterase-like activity of phytase family protein [Vibrio mediterranei]MCY9855869.1 esterase-like activity of phytase family protein [Vibrio mediterranei]